MAAAQIGRVIGRAAELGDLAIFQLFPKWGARRMAVRRMFRLADERRDLMQRAFAGAESDRISAGRWLTSRLSPDSALEEDLTDLRERCEQLYRSDTIAHSAVEGRVANEIGTGLAPQVILAPDETPDEQKRRRIATRLETAAARWSAAGVDRSGGESFGQVQKLVDRTFAICGECFIALADVGAADKPVPLTLDVIHPSRVETPPDRMGDPLVRMGVERSASGRVVAYHVRRTHPGDSLEAQPVYDRIEARDAAGQPRMLHVFDPFFAGQSRGFPWMAAALARIKDVGDIVEYELIAKQVETCFAAFVSGGSQSPLSKAEAASSDTDTDGRRLEELRPGAIDYLEEGEEINFANPQRPGPTFFPLIEYSLRSIAAALNYPYELLANNFFRTTFSAGRLAMLAGRVGFRMRRRVVVEKLLTPVWGRFVFEAVLVGILDDVLDAADYKAAPHVYSGVRWQEPGWSYIDPEKEVKANVLGVKNDLNTIANAVGEQGGDLETHLEQRFKEKSALVEQTVKLRKLARDLERKYGLQPADDDQTAATAAEAQAL